MSAWFVYILRCGNNSLYTGITVNLSARIRRHLSGQGAKYTRAFPPTHLVYSQKLNKAATARKQEASIKRLSKTAKENFVRAANQPVVKVQ